MSGYVSPFPTVVELDFTNRVAGQPQERRMHVFHGPDGREVRCDRDCRECFRERNWSFGQTRGDQPRRPIVIPVIHYGDDTQALQNAERAFDAGCPGVMLIEMWGRNCWLPAAAQAIKARWSDRMVGLNFLGASTATDLPYESVHGLDMTWTDEQLTHSDGRSWSEARTAARGVALRQRHLLFCAVAFKYQRPEPNPVTAAAWALSLGFIPTTSGPATGAAADPSAIEALREALGPAAPLAIASGITPENAPVFLPHVSHVLVSTGVSSSFHEFDPARLRDLMAVAA